MINNATACDTEQPSYLASILPISVVAPLIAAVVGGAAFWIKKKFSVSDKAMTGMTKAVEAVIDSVDGLKTDLQPNLSIIGDTSPPSGGSIPSITFPSIGKSRVAKNIRASLEDELQPPSTILTFEPHIKPEVAITLEGVDNTQTIHNTTHHNISYV